MKIKTFKEYLASNAEDIKDLRLERANLDAAAASSAYIEKYKQNFRKSQSEFEEMLDLNDDNKNDLAKRIKNFDANTWVDKLYKKSLEIVNKSIAINCAVKLHNSLFPDEKKVGLTEYENALVEMLTGKKI
jgi:tetratricopeptide (TPR) repeat protein